MLAKDSPSGRLQGRVLLPDADDRTGFFLRQNLLQRFGEPVAAEFRLEVDTLIEERGLAIAEDNSITRISLRATAAFRLVRMANNETILEGAVASESAYNSTSALYATRQLDQDVRRRLANDLGERISRRIFGAADRIAGT